MQEIYKILISVKIADLSIKPKSLKMFKKWDKTLYILWIYISSIYLIFKILYYTLTKNENPRDPLSTVETSFDIFK